MNGDDVASRMVMRVRDVFTGQVLDERALDIEDDIDAAADASRAITDAHVERTGHAVRLECRDPDGCVLPAGRWVAIATVHPEGRHS